MRSSNLMSRLVAVLAMMVVLAVVPVVPVMADGGESQATSNETQGGGESDSDDGWWNHLKEAAAELFGEVVVDRTVGPQMEPTG